MASSSSNTQILDVLPSALLATILSKLDIPSICSASSTCKSLNSLSSHILSFLPSFHLLDVAVTRDMLRPLLVRENKVMKSLKVDCKKLGDECVEMLVKEGLDELCLVNCENFSGRLLKEIGEKCKDLRSLYLGAVAEKQGQGIDISEFEELLSGCSHLESLSLLFDVSIFHPQEFGLVWEMASSSLESLEIGFISSLMIAEVLNPMDALNKPQSRLRLPVLPSIHKLCLVVDFISDSLVSTISKGLVSLTHLDLRDAPVIEPTSTFDLTNSGMDQINQNGKLTHLSLVRSQEYVLTYFRHVNDLGLLLMADKCSTMESISLGGFCRVTDSGFRAVLHSCTKLQKLRVCYGTQLTDLVFHDMSATSLCLTNVSLRWCSLLTNLAVLHLASNTNLKMLDLRDCRNLGDDALKALNSLRRLKILLLDGSDISDAGLSHLGHEMTSSLISLSLRGCRRLTDRCITAIFNGSSGQSLRNLDLSNLPNLSDKGILSLARSRVPVTELRLRECHQIGDTSVMALASMQVDDGGWQGSSLKLLDIFDCRGITQLAFRWFKKPYFPRLRWFGITGCVNRDLVDALSRSRPYLHMAIRGEELGTGRSDITNDGLDKSDCEVDELEQWLIEGGYGSYDEEMEVDEADDEEIIEDQ